MDTIQVDIINPKAIKLLGELAELNLIAIRPATKNDFSITLKKLRAKAASAPTLDEITKEVEQVRANRYAK